MATKKQNRFESAYRQFAERQNKALLVQLIKSKSLTPRLTPLIMIGTLYALAVHLVAVCFFIGGLWLIITGWPYLFVIIGGLLSLGIAWETRPRFGYWPKKGILPRAIYPALYSLVDQVADALSIQHIEAIQISTDVNAGIIKLGLRHRPLMWIGLPLWAILNEQERVGLIAHELAHYANGDSIYGWLISSAVQSLELWYRLLSPPPRYAVRTRASRSSEDLARLFMSFIAHLTLGARFVLRHLFAQNLRRAEYLADYLSATVSGTNAIAGVLQRLQVIDPVSAYPNRVASGYELERIMQEDQEVASRLDLTHPPLSYRLELLQARPINQPKVILSTAQSAEIDKELSTLTSVPKRTHS